MRRASFLASLLSGRSILRPDLRVVGVLAAVLIATVVLLNVGRPGTATAAVTSDSGTIGLSVQGRAIEVACLGTGDHTVLVVGGLHTGPEAVSAELVLELATLGWSGGIDVPADTQLCLIPTLNPDGLVRGTRTNARGVDLNRNWPSLNWTSSAYHPEGGSVSGGSEPLSEPETRALWNYALQTRPDAIFVLHCCGSVVEANESPRAEAFADAYAGGSRYEHIAYWTAYPVTGQFIDAMDRVEIAAIDVEMTSLYDTTLSSHLAGIEAALAVAAKDTPTGVVLDDTRQRAASAWTTYRVRPGDTLANIAFRYGTTAITLASANRLARPELIEVGQVLSVPR